MDHVQANRRYWQGRAGEYVSAGEAAWSASEPRWGIWGIAESRVRMLPERCAGLDAVELGCGTGYVSAWLARRGARPVGLDNSLAQLITAARLQRKHALSFPLIHADAERSPLRGECADLVISEYGACLWCDPYRWVPEAARLLRPGGELRFLTNGFLLTLVLPPDVATAGRELLLPQFGAHRTEELDGSVDFHLPHGEMIRLLRSCGLEVLELLELEAPADASTRYDFVSAEWAAKWPSEEAWKAVKRGR